MAPDQVLGQRRLTRATRAAESDPHHYPPVRNESPIVSPTAAARPAAAPTRPGASRRLGTAVYSQLGHPPLSRRLWRLRRGRWGRRFWGGQLAHPGNDALSLESLQRSLDELLHIAAHVANRLGQGFAGLSVELGEDLVDYLPSESQQFV